MENKKICNKGVQIVIKYYKKNFPHKLIRKTKFGEGCDIFINNEPIEIKSTSQTFKQKNNFTLTKNEYLTVCKNKNYQVFWVNVKENKIILRINRDEILANTESEIRYILNLTKLKKKLKNEK